MEMIQVRSSANRAVGYDQPTQRMRITFEQGDSYDFCGVPLHVYEGLMSASSKGAYLSGIGTSVPEYRAGVCNRCMN